MSSTSFESEEFRRTRERRRLPRLRLPSLAYVDVDSDNGGILLNLSETGLALQAVAPFAGLTRVSLGIQPPKPRRRLDLDAEITWLSESKKEAGLQFLELSEETRIEIANWISEEGGARGPVAAGDSAAPPPAQVSQAQFPEEAPAPRRKWSRSLENSPSPDAPPNQQMPSELPRPPMASGNLELHSAAILREQSADVPAQNPRANIETIPAPTGSPNERPADPIVFSEKVSPATGSPSPESPDPVEAPPRRPKWPFLLENSRAQETPPIHNTPCEIPRRVVGSTYIERLTDAILRKNSVDVSPKNPVSTNEKIHARTAGSNVQPDSAIIHSQHVSDAAQSPLIELPAPPARPGPILPLPAAGPIIQPPSASHAGPIARPNETPKTSIPSAFEDFPRSGERRHITRQRIFSLAYLEVGPDNGGMVLDLSESGLALQAFNPLIGLTRVSLRIQAPKSRTRIAAAAEIIWLSESQTEAGLKFLALSEDARMEIADWISAEAAVPEPARTDDSASRQTQIVPSAQTSSVTVTEERYRNREDWFPPVGDSNSEESLANRNLPHDSPNTSPNRGDFAVQLGSAVSEKLSEHSANDPSHSQLAIDQQAGIANKLTVDPSLSSEPVPDVRHPPLKLPVPRTAASRPFASEQFRKWGAIAALCACVALVSLFVGMAISRGLLSDRATRLSAEEKAREAAASSAPPATAGTPVTHDVTAGTAAFPVDASASKTRPAASASVSRAPQMEIRERHSSENSKLHATRGEADPIAAELPPAIAPTPETVERDAQTAAVPSVPVWTAQTAANPNRPVGGLATNPAPVRVPERRSDCYLLYRVEPLYPREAREQRVEGTVIVHLQIGTDGRVRSSRELSGPAPLVPAALAAVREWRFIPALLNGQPVDTEKDVSIEFQLSR